MQTPSIFRRVSAIPTHLAHPEKVLLASCRLHFLSKKSPSARTSKGVLIVAHNDESTGWSPLHSSMNVPIEGRGCAKDYVNTELFDSCCCDLLHYHKVPAEY